MSSEIKNVRVEYHIETTVNTGNFQNIKPGYTLSCDVEPGTDVNDVRAKLKAKANQWLEEDLKEIQEDLNN